MANKMLIDASHPEETRVVVVRGNRIEEFDFESEHKKQIRGNIYLARVTRVEPSLQAAFVEYGGNRHGFLAFSEIHPDYYQIPHADRQALLEAEAAEHAEEDEDEERPARRASRDDRDGRDGGRRRRRERGPRRGEQTEGESVEAAADQPNDDVSEITAEEGSATEESNDGEAKVIEMAIEADVISESADGSDEPKKQTDAEDTEDELPSEELASDEGQTHIERSNAEQIDEPEVIESVGSGSEDSMEELRHSRRVARRQYKIQEVIKRRQVLLVQVVKEERGNKGAALTTYLSLAGRYSVLMPNTGRGGGISRKITSIQDRKRLKDVVKDLEVPQGMGVILRTAGANRTKAEIKRDYEYLMRMWETVRTLTLQSQAPTLVYEEGSLIKRSIRDLYNKDISEIQVAGENGYREAKDFMRMLMPSHAKMVQPYRESTPIFAKAGIESQLDKMLQPQVTLKSGGYIIINQTEALVAIDVNSGRSTREHSIEDTALQTNLEASEEVARQLRLRDLAGLIVIDFIDMEENRNNRAVEKRLKDCLKNDRARIQVGRISHFGLMEMSRQRIRTSVLESTTQVCPQCGGVGHVRSPSSISLHVIRSIEEHLLRESGFDVTVRTPTASALYVLNHKRQSLSDLEDRFGLNISVEADDSVGAQHLAIDRGPASTRTPSAPKASPLPDFDETDPDIPMEENEGTEGADSDSEASDETQPRQNGEARDGDGKRGKRRRRRGRGRGRDGDGAPRNANGEPNDEGLEALGADDEPNGDGAEPKERAENDREDSDRKKRRRGRRGGRRDRPEGDAVATDPSASSEAVVAVAQPAEVPEVSADPEAEAPAKPKRGRTRKVKADEATEAGPTVAAEAALSEAVSEVSAAEKPSRSRRKLDAEAAAAAAVVSSSAPAEPDAPSEEAKPRKGGWWQRKGFF
jgi:ribonuclease E